MQKTTLRRVEGRKQSSATTGNKMASRLHLRINGLVQGVCFRASLRQRAVSLALCGWVRNVGRAQVEAMVWGSESALQEIARWCRVGPPGARVEAIQVDWDHTPQNHVPVAFTIRPSEDTEEKV